MLSLVKVRRNAGSKTSPSYIEEGQVFDVVRDNQPDSEVLRLCALRDKLNEWQELHRPASRTGKPGRFTIIDEHRLEVEL